MRLEDETKEVIEVALFAAKVALVGLLFIGLLFTVRAHLDTKAELEYTISVLAETQEHLAFYKSIVEEGM